MTELSATVQISGSNVSPAEFTRRTGIQTSRRLEVGETIAKGRRAGSPSKEGVAYVDIHPAHSDVLREVCRIVRAARAHSEHATVQVYLVGRYSGQCNLSLDKTTLASLYHARAVLNISCYEQETPDA